MIPSLPELHFMFEVEGSEHLEGIDIEALKVAFHRGALFGGQWLQGLWIRIAQERDIRRSGEYIRGIQEQGRIEVSGDGFDLLIEITNTCGHASIVEDGHAAFSMVAAINWSGGSVKHGAKGPYLHIPFRHSAYASSARADAQGLTMGTRRAMMPEDIYRKAKRLQYRQRLNVGRQYDASGRFVAADRYAWQHPNVKAGRRMHRGEVSAAFTMGGPGVDLDGWAGSYERRSTRLVGRDHNGNPLINPTWKQSKFEGLFKTGAPRHSEYMTIRTITPRSEGWNIPAQAGHGIARTLASIAPGSEALNTVISSAMASVLAGGGAP